jgi:hypothetical protein
MNKQIKKLGLTLLLVLALKMSCMSVTDSEKSWTYNGVVGRPTTISTLGSARFVRLELVGEGWLNLAEVEVWGTRDLSVASENLALGKPASQSSTADNDQAVAGLAVDGNTNGIFAEHSISHTNREQNPWWEVDLGEVCAIQEVRVWNRSDGVEDRLKNVKIIFSDKPFAIQITQNVKDLSPEVPDTIYPKAWGYLRLPVFGGLLLVISWLIHLFVWNVKIPVFPIRILISVFGFVFFAGTVFVIILPTRVQPIKDIWEYLLVLSFYGSIALLYISSYEEINHKGSTYPLFKKLLQAGTKGLSQEVLLEAIKSKIQHDIELELVLLQDKKRVRTEGQVMTLTKRGKVCGTFINKYFRWLG